MSHGGSRGGHGSRGGSVGVRVERHTGMAACAWCLDLARGCEEATPGPPTCGETSDPSHGELESAVIAAFRS